MGADQIITMLEEFYAKSPTLYLLWNFSQGAVTNLTSEGLEKIVTTAKNYAHMRKGGKTAIAAPRDLEFGTARMYENVAEMNQHPLPHKVVREKDEAIKWLLEKNN